MSYDILLYPRRPGQDWEQVLAADEARQSAEEDAALGDEASLTAGVRTWRRIEARVREALTEPVETWVAEEVGGDVFGELSVPSTGLQVELYEGSAEVSLDHREHDDLDAFHAQVREAVRIVAEETGYDAYDPQIGGDFDGTIRDEAGREVTGQQDAEGMARPTGDIGDTGGAGVAGVPRDPRHRPDSMRRRGILYLVLGLVLTFFAVWRMSVDQGGILVTILLVIGFIDLIGGVFMLWAAGQMRQRNVEEQQG